MRRHIRTGISTARGFTLMELLVVVGIIMLMTALSMPAIKKFMDGQRLQQSGRILQSAFNEARRAAITQRERNYLVLFREGDPTIGDERYGMRRFRAGIGYEGEAHLLLKGVQFDLQAPGGGGGGAQGVFGQTRPLRLSVFDTLPNESDQAIFGINRLPNMNGTTYNWVEFRKDGTLRWSAGIGDDKQPPSQGAAAGLFDLNVRLDSVPENTVDDVDLSLRESGDHGVNERCFVDVDRNTGRVRFRVVRTDLGGGGTQTN